MSIQRRLFVSNILMVVIPLVLCLVLAAGGAAVLYALVREHDDRTEGVRVLTAIMARVDELAQDYTATGDEAALLAGVQALNAELDDDASVVVYQNGEVQGNRRGQPDAASRRAATMDGGGLVVVDEHAAYAADAGDYRLVLSGGDALDGESFFGGRTMELNRHRIAALALLAMTSFVGIILATNLILTRRMYKSIMDPLETLVDGVHEIGGGNLAFRIDYTAKDEFGAVCEDFNEMARQLQAMVDARLRDSESRKELVAGISHDLRTPLTSIKAYVEGLETGVAATPALKQKYLATIRQKAEDLEHIVSQLFLFSKLDLGEFPLDMEPLDIEKELAAYFAEAAPEYAAKGLVVTFEGSVDGARVAADAVQLRNVLTNILENSLRYGHRAEKQVRASLSLEDESVQVALADNGPGVPPEALPRLFEVFYRADASRSSDGSGLGLAIAAKIVEGFGGSIRAENRPQSGLAIIISLPVATEETP